MLRAAAQTMKTGPKESLLPENLASDNMETLLLILSEFSRPGAFGHVTITFKDGRIVNNIGVQMTAQIAKTGQWSRSAVQDILRRLAKKSGIEVESNAGT